MCNLFLPSLESCFKRDWIGYDISGLNCTLGIFFWFSRQVFQSRYGIDWIYCSERSIKLPWPPQNSSSDLETGAFDEAVSTSRRGENFVHARYTSKNHSVFRLLPSISRCPIVLHFRPAVLISENVTWPRCTCNCFVNNGCQWGWCV